MGLRATQSSARRTAMRIGLPLAISLALFGSPRPAAASEIICLWTSLTGVEKARLELAARIGEAPPTALLNRKGEAGLAAYIAECGLSLDPDDIDRASLYLSARSKESVLAAELTGLGLPPEVALATLDAVAPPNARRRLAEGVLLFESGVSTEDQRAARAVVRRTARLLADRGPALGIAGRELIAAEWATARLLVDGLEQGAEPPDPR